MRRRIAPAFALLALLSASCVGARTAAVSGAAVSTLAGNGAAGFSDGRASDAEFMFPVALAYDRRDGSTYVADSAAQRIRRIAADGSVSSIAGSGAPLPSGLEVAGGYVDGPAASARFNLPMGIAVANDGTLYVADSFNHCIRRIRDGVVSTYAGNPRTPGSDDGSLRFATFVEPRALAIGSDGTLYVADYTVGLRQISAAGVVSTLSILRPDAVTVSLWEDRDGAVLFAASRRELVRYDLRGDVRQRVVTVPQRQEGMPAEGILALGPDRVLVSSAIWHDVWYVDFPRPWNAGQGFARLLAGQDEKDWQQNGGFADGPPERAEFYDPMGMARDARGNVLLADAGNRRVRVLPAPDARVPDPAQPAPLDPADYHVVVVANASGYSNAMNGDSIAATLERRLNDGRTQGGPAKPVAARTVSLGRSDVAGQAEYLTQLQRSAADLVVWSFDAQTFSAPPDAPNTVLTDRGLVAMLVHATAERLRARGIRLVLAVHPFGAELAPDEATALQAAPLPAESSAVAAARYADLEHFIAGLGLPTVTTLARFQAAERGPHAPFFAPDDDELAPAGNALYADAIAAELQRLRPW